MLGSCAPTPVKVGSNDTPSLRAGAGRPASSANVGIQSWNCDGDSLLVPANSFVLARSLEYFRIPREVVTICTGKSTYARCGIIVNVTPFEPEWEGFATLSLSNTGPRPVRVYAEEGIAQLLFLEASEICEVSYQDKKGKYQAQKEITLSINDKDRR